MERGQPVPDPSSTRDRPPVRILVVEDNPGDVRLLDEVLEPEALHVQLVHVADGAEALEYVEAAVQGLRPLPQVVLLDLNLPKYGGKRVLQAIRSHPAWDRVRVIVLSGSADPADAEESRGMGADEYLSKPCDLEQFLRLGERLKAHVRESLPG
jgi:two-component system, chemotaxis family, response regulator Rcp1